MRDKLIQAMIIQLLHPFYFIGILNFDYFLNEDDLSSHSPIDEATGENGFKDLKFRFTELKKV
ncbi:MAG: hypothetical protein HC892_18940 [Saprospiraceae bacterium]|nr:hypothetical protein [Saprospiraceae bacterium]